MKTLLILLLCPLFLFGQKKEETTILIGFEDVVIVWYDFGKGWKEVYAGSSKEIGPFIIKGEFPCKFMVTHIESDIDYYLEIDSIDSKLVHYVRWHNDNMLLTFDEDVGLIVK